MAWTKARETRARGDLIRLSGVASVAVLVSSLVGYGGVVAAASSPTRVGAASAPSAEIVGWGSDLSGQLGEANLSDRRVPGYVRGLPAASAVSAGDRHGLAVIAGHVWSWGLNYNAQLAGPDGPDSDPYSNTAYRSQPQQIRSAPLTGVTGVAAGWTHSLAVRADGSVWGWGDNAVGELGTANPAAQQLVGQVPGITNARAVAAGEGDSLALRSDGTVVAWGYGANGQLGNGTHGDERPHPVPAAVKGLSQVVKVAAGGDFNIALRSDGTVWTWGHNNHGQLGDATTVDRSTPVQVGGLDHIVGVAASMNGTNGDSQHALAVGSDGAVLAWGDNADGELGDNTVTDRHSPVRVAGIGSALGVAAGGRHSAARLRDGTVVSWGANDRGQLGDGTTIERRCRVTSKTLRGVTQLDAGNDYTLGLAQRQTLASIPASITFQGELHQQNGNAADGGRLTQYTPVRTRKGDLLIAHVSARTDLPLPTPAGWVPAARSHLPGQHVGQADLVDAVFWRVAPADGQQPWTFSLADATDGAAAIATFSGVSTTSPVAAAATATNPYAIEHQRAPSIVTPVPNSRILAVYTTNDSAGIDPPRGYEEHWRTDLVGAGDGTEEGTSADDPRSGPTGDVQLSTTPTAGIGHLIALRPAPSPK